MQTAVFDIIAIIFALKLKTIAMICRDYDRNNINRAANGFSWRAKFTLEKLHGKFFDFERSGVTMADVTSGPREEVREEWTPTDIRGVREGRSKALVGVGNREV